MYSRQAKNTDAERRASEIRLRAERRAGQLLKEMARADAPNPSGKNQHEVASNDVTQPDKSAYATALESSGLSRQVANRYQALANVPEEDFEAALSNPEKKPSTTGLISLPERP